MQFILYSLVLLAVSCEVAADYRPLPDCTDDMKTGRCPKTMDPLCASDGRTYNNDCLFCYETYRLNLEDDLHFEHWGACKPEDIPATECTDEMKKGCNEIYYPICASDGVTYDNLCQMCQRKFQLIDEGKDKDDLRAVSLISCRPDQAAMQCTPDMKHHNCPDTFKPVCALHGSTYKNSCELCSFMYEVEEQLNTTEVYIGIIYEGECKHNKTMPSGCVAKDFLPASDCYWSPPLAPICQLKKCEAEGKQVCGSDGNTYDSKCHLCAHRFFTETKGIPTTLELDHDGDAITINKSQGQSLQVYGLNLQNPCFSSWTIIRWMLPGPCAK